MKVVVFAYHNMGIIGLEALKQEGFNIQAIFSHQDDPQENCWFGSVVEWAEKNRIPVFCPETVNTPEWIEKIGEMEPDVVFSFYYRHLLGKDILKIPKTGAYNLHGSLLPAYRGRSPVNWVLVNGEQRTGVTLHEMVEKADAGSILGQKAVRIEFEDTALTLYQKLCAVARELLEELLPLIKKGIAPRREQDLTSGSYFGGRRPEDGKIDWRWPVIKIYNLIRAVTEPYPGAFTYLPEGKKMMIWWAHPELDGSSNAMAGTVEADKNNIYVKTSDGRLRLIEIELEKERMKGHRIFEYFRNREGTVLK
jgi:UDP-4-amino-4-deoxy-L-arabinose formyltransferase/UDP-glucuronic acid dehydrogenase (UDP-4-keto-hexauronic acid decarboxylating)